MIRRSVLSRLRAALGAHQAFDPDDFSIEVSGDEQAALKTVYRLDDAVRFVATFAPERAARSEIRLECWPGVILERGMTVVEDVDGLVVAIGCWLQRVAEDQAAAHGEVQAAARTTELRRIELMVLSHVGSTPAFAFGERGAVGARLGTLETSLLSRFPAGSDQEALRSDVEAVRCQLTQLERIAWIRSAVVRVFKWAVRAEVDDAANLTVRVVSSVLGS